MAELTDSQRLREAAKWFDMIDVLLNRLTIKETGRTIAETIGNGREIQADLLRIADELEAS